jgi:hypothetical protein
MATAIGGGFLSFTKTPGEGCRQAFDILFVF